MYPNLAAIIREQLTKHRGIDTWTNLEQIAANSVYNALVR